ncbi:MAG: Wzz/FepE/Etk N-terminal domain-containing protein [Rhodospirillaceae bacterium]
MTINSSDLDLDLALRTLWRRRSVLGGAVALTVAVALLVVFQIPPRYTATALVMLSPRAPQVMDAAEVVPALGLDSPAVHSEVEILRSRTLAEAVVDVSGLMNDPEFNPDLTPPPLWRLLMGLGATSDGGDGPLARERVVETFREALRADPVNRSLVVAVRVTSADAVKAARLADATAGMYLERQVRAKLTATRDAADWLGERVETLRREATEAEAAVAAYRARHGLGQDQESSLAADERSRLNASLAEIRAVRADADARHQRLRNAAENPAAVGEVLASPVIHRLREQEAQVGRQLADLSARYGPLHPRLAETQAEQDDVRRQIAAEVRRIADGVADEARVAAVREAAVLASLNDLERRRAAEGAASAPLLALEREAAAARALHESFLRRSKEAAEQIALQSPDGRLISPAAVPVKPSYPRKTMTVAAAAGVGLLIALALVFVLERLDRGLRRPEDVERRLGRPMIGQVPLARPPSAVPDAVAAEEMRQIRTALSLLEGRTPRVLAVTSSLPGEGKTTLCLWLARTAAAGRRVVLVDADLRRPRLGALAGASEGPGLAAVLAGEATLDEALRPGPVEGLSILPGRPLGGAAADLLGGAAMRGVLDDLRARFDLVVIDTPPVLPVADARVLAPLADAVLYAVRWEKTPDDVAAQGIARLTSGGIAPLVVLSQVDLKRQGSYGYGGYVRYYGRYGAYYAES